MTKPDYFKLVHAITQEVKKKNPSAHIIRIYSEPRKGDTYSTKLYGIYNAKKVEKLINGTFGDYVTAYTLKHKTYRCNWQQQTVRFKPNFELIDKNGVVIRRGKRVK